MSAPDQLPTKKTTTLFPSIQSGKAYWVQCKDYRCLAILSREGTWRCFSTGNELLDEVVEVYAPD